MFPETQFLGLWLSNHVLNVRLPVEGGFSSKFGGIPLSRLVSMAYGERGCYALRPSLELQLGALSEPERRRGRR
jgi:hypothetical protein